MVIVKSEKLTKEERDKRKLALLLRHQIFVEAYKNYIINSITPYLSEVRRNINKILENLGTSRVSNLTKSVFKITLSNTERSINNTMRVFEDDLYGQLKEFNHSDKQILLSIYMSLLHDESIDKLVPVRDALSWLWDKSIDKENSTLQSFDEMWNDPMSLGMYPNDLISMIKSSLIVKIKTAMISANADDIKIEELKQIIYGTRELNYKDGKLNEVLEIASKNLKSLIQHVTVSTQEDIESKLFRYYQWVSVMDSRTSEICRGRNKNIYVYGKGPIPPAHFNCRSKIMFLESKQNEDLPTYDEWLKDQPESIQKYVTSDKNQLSANGFKNKASDILQ